MKITWKIIITIVTLLLLVYLLLLIPDSPPGRVMPDTGGKPFAWNKDDFWKGLERTFLKERTADSALREARLVKMKSTAETSLAKMEGKRLSPDDSVFSILLYNFFEMVPLVAAGNQHQDWLISYYNRLRNGVKLQSQNWDMNTGVARNTIYQLLYGMRAAIEEVLLQSPGMKFNPVMFVKDELSVTPAARIFGITVHSGDLLVSRGGAVASALISRGNDYPGNFSHVAMIYVDKNTSIPYLVEAHIEKGVKVSSVARYIADKKLRFMVMRPRYDLPQLIADPLIPQKAAEYIYHEALSGYIPYDFQMNYHDSSAMFCSEVCSWAYRRFGIQPWQGISTISSPGVVGLLHEFGVENFVTMTPSDLEYDPQLSVVAEWRDPRTLFLDHIYNAVVDVMIENADKNGEIRINRWLLPVARILKGYSVLLNIFHNEGPIPDGMSATQGLKNNAFDDLHSRIRSRTEEKARLFIDRYGYIPPYWQLIRMAKESLASVQ